MLELVPRAWLSILPRANAAHLYCDPGPEPDSSSQSRGQEHSFTEAEAAGQYQLIGNVAILRGRNFSESLSCLGGPRVLIPLFCLCKGDEQAAMLVRTLAEVLHADFSSRQAFLRLPAAGRGFQLVAYLLAQTELAGVGVKLVAALKLLADGLPQNDAVWADAQIHLIWHFPLWVYASEAFQLGLLQMLHEWVVVDPERFRRLVGAQRLLDMIRLCWWDDMNNSLAAPNSYPVPANVLPIAAFDQPSTRHFSPAGSGRQSSAAAPVVNSRPGSAGRSRIRRKALSLLAAMVGGPSSFSASELKAVVSFANECPDGSAVADVLSLLLMLFSGPPAEVAPMAEHLAKLGGALVFLPIFRRGHLKVDAIGVQLLGQLAALATEPGKEFKDLLGGFGRVWTAKVRPASAFRA